MPRINELDRRVLATLSGGEKVKALLSDKGLSLAAFAEKHNLWVQNVSYCVHGDRPLPEIREKLAAELDLSRAALDSLIDGTAAKASA